MHLQSVNTASYYSASATTTTLASTGPCVNMTVTFRIARAVQTCMSAVGTNSTAAYNASAASPQQLATLHARNIDSTESQGMHTSAIIGIIAAVAIGCLVAAAIVGHSCLSNRNAFAKSSNTRGHARRYHASSGEKGHAIPMQTYRGGAGISAPPRSHSGRARAPQFPGPRNGFAANRFSGTSYHLNSRGPYASTPFSAVPTFGAGGSMYH